MINVYGLQGKTMADFERLGYATIQAYRAKVTCTDNGKYVLDLECPVEYSDLIVEDAQITAESPSPDGTIRKQVFRVSDVERRRKKMTATCPHISFDLDNYIVAHYESPEGATCAQVVAALQTATDAQHPFTLHCNITSPINMVFERMSLSECLDKICQYFGAHIIRDNFDITIAKNHTEDFGARIAYGKNLKDISCFVDWSDVCTKVFPVGEDNITIDGLYLEATSIDGLTDYGIPYTKVVSFQQDRELTEKIQRSDYETAEENRVLNGHNLRESDYANRSDYTTAVQAAYWSEYFSGSYPATEAADEQIKDEKNARIDAAYNAARAAVLKPDLVKLATNYLKNHNVPTVRYRIKADVPEITYIGQIGHLYDKHLGIYDLKFTLTEFEYDCILMKMTEFVYGDVLQPLIGEKTDAKSFARQDVMGAKGNVPLMENYADDTFIITENSAYIVTEVDQYIPIEE